MEFLKTSELSLNAAGYLTIKKTGKPVAPINPAFVTQQKNAEYIVKLADAIAGKTFSAGKLDDLEAIKASVKASMYDETKTYVAAPSKPVSKVNDELVKFALDFDKYNDDKTKTDKINEFMQQFNAISDVETVGDYFTEGVVKLSRIYSIGSILNAVEIHVEKLK